MLIKEKLENILDGFIERNKDYTVTTYVRNGVTRSIITRLQISE